MTNPIRRASNLLVCSQLGVEVLAAPNAVGIRSIVCNLADRLAPDVPQTLTAEPGDSVRKRGLLGRLVGGG